MTKISISGVFYQTPTCHPIEMTTENVLCNSTDTATPEYTHRSFDEVIDFEW